MADDPGNPVVVKEEILEVAPVADVTDAATLDDGFTSDNTDFNCGISHLGEVPLYSFQEVLIKQECHKDESAEEVTPDEVDNLKSGIQCRKTIIKEDPSEEVAFKTGEGSWVKEESDGTDIAGESGELKCRYQEIKIEGKTVDDINCKKGLETEDENLSSHLPATHSQRYACDMCDFRCDRIYNLNVHKKTHEGEKPFACDMCHYRCRWACQLKVHKIVHTGEKPYVCDMCDYRCRQATQMKIHKMKHAGKFPFPCDVCNYRCRRASQLNNHKRIHSGETPFVCEVCDYRCNDNSHLNVHKRIHTGEKPFACDVCDYRCNDGSYLKVHKRIHTGEKPFACDECDYRCRQSYDLKVHKRIHSGEKPLACEVCGYRCRQAGNLKVHKMTHTGKKLES